MINEGPALYLTNDGRIVLADNPAAAFLAVGAGCQVPNEHADAVKAYHAYAEQAKRLQPLDNKRRAPAENK